MSFLTNKQINLLENIRDQIKNGCEYAYLECGKRKAYRSSTLYGLARRGAVTYEEVAYQVFEVRLTEEWA